MKEIATAFETGIDALILEDYNKGVLSKEMIAKVISMAKQKEIFVSVDPKTKLFGRRKPSQSRETVRSTEICPCSALRPHVQAKVYQQHRIDFIFDHVIPEAVFIRGHTNRSSR